MNLTTNDLILESLENFKKELKLKYGTRAELIAVHFICGNDSAFEALRKSTFHAPNISKDPNEVYRVLTAHIREFERENVLLGLATKWAAKKRNNKIKQFLLKVQNVNNAEKEPYKIRFIERTKKSVIEGTLIVPNGLIQELCPKHHAIKFINAIRAKKNEDIEQYLHFFDLRRASIFGKVLEIESVIEEISKLIPSEVSLEDNSPDLKFESNYEKEKSLWKVLQGILSTSIFCSASARTEFWKPGEEIRVYLDKFEPQNNHAISGIALYPFFFKSPDDNASQFFHDMREEFNDIRIKVNEYINIPPRIPTDVSPKFYAMMSAQNGDDYNEKSKKDLEEVGRKIFPIKFQEDLAYQISNWLLCLIERLKEKRHEGQGLDFWFVIGDVTRFKDNKMVTLKRFKDLKKDFDKAIFPLGIPKDAGKNKYEEALEKAARFLAYEHFPWFQRGKFALFWDVSNLIEDKESTNKEFHKAYPYGLVSLNGTNWEQFLLQYYNKKYYLHIPNNILIYTKNSPPDSGLITTRTTASDGYSQKQLFYMRNKMWVNSHFDERGEILDTVLRLIKNPQLKEKLKRLVIRIADNPLNGGTLIILDPDSRNSIKPQLAKMGVPWMFSDDISDIEALMSHDGATIFKEVNNSEKWDFRLLLSSTSKVTKDLEKLAIDSTQNFALSGVGSRRWSAAITAFNKNVKAVIVISQDGDLTCWLAPGTGFEDAIVFDLKAGIKPATEGKPIMEFIGKP